MVFKDDGGCFVKINSATNVPGCVPGVVPAANVICGISKETAHTSSIVSHNPIWNHVLEFRAAAKKESILFIIRDADQILGSLQVPLKDIAAGSVTTRAIDTLKQSPCTLSFTLTYEDRSSLARKRLLMTTKKFKDSVLSRFGSDPALNIAGNIPQSSASVEPCEQRKPATRTIQRCHSYVNERTRVSKITRHQYVNCSKQRSCGELGKNVDLAALAGIALRDKHQTSPVGSRNNKLLLVLIQGRNLGTCRADIISVHVGGVDCTGNIQHFSSEKLLVRLPRSAPLSPVSVVTKSGGIGQQNAKVKVTFESASSSDEIKSLKRSEQEGAISPLCFHKPPRANRNRQIRTSGAYSTGSSDSGSDNMCVNTRTPAHSFVPPPRRRSTCSSYSSKSSIEPADTSPSTPDTCSSSSTEPSTPDTCVTTTPDTCVTTTPDTSTPDTENSSARQSVSPNSKKRFAIISPLAVSDIIAPPEPFSEGSTPVPRQCEEDQLLDLTKTELVEEIIRLRGVLSKLQN